MVRTPVSSCCMIQKQQVRTVKALPDMIAYFREQGYTFCTVAQMDALQCETK